MLSITHHLTSRRASIALDGECCTEFDIVFYRLPYELRDHYGRVDNLDEHFIGSFIFHSYARVVRDYHVEKKIIFGRSERVFAEKWWLFDDNKEVVYSLTTMNDQRVVHAVPFATLFQRLMQEERARLHFYEYSKEVNGVYTPSPSNARQSTRA